MAEDDRSKYDKMLEESIAKDRAELERLEELKLPGQQVDAIYRSHGVALPKEIIDRLDAKMEFEKSLLRNRIEYLSGVSNADAN